MKMTETKGFFTKIYFAVISGVCAAFGSLFGKLFGLFDEASISLLSEYLPVEDGKEMIHMRGLQSLCFVLMLLCNASVWTFYVKALQHSNSSLPVTIISTAVNFIMSAFLGNFLFDEASGLLWWTGSGIVIIGLALITRSSHELKTKAQ